MNRDPYLYPEVDVLKNKFGIKDAKALQRLETALTTSRMAQPMQEEPTMTSEGYQAIHQHIFGDIYPWAGKFRTCELSKGVSAFEYAAKIPAKMEDAFKNLKAENNLKDLSSKEFSKKAAAFLYKLNDIHPFREGNGRVQRIFLDILAKQAGHKLDQTRISPTKWMAGSIDSFTKGDRGNHQVMTEVIKDSLVKRTKYRPKTRGRGDDYDRGR